MQTKESVNKQPPERDFRPKCQYCFKRLRPYMYGGYLKEPEKYWSGNYHGYTEFCTLRHALYFARAALEAGYRIKPKRLTD